MKWAILNISEDNFIIFNFVTQRFYQNLEIVLCPQWVNSSDEWYREASEYFILLNLSCFSTVLKMQGYMDLVPKKINL